MPLPTFSERKSGGKIVFTTPTGEGKTAESSLREAGEKRKVREEKILDRGKKIWRQSIRSRASGRKKLR